jgi:hypothetical protein
MPGRECYHCKQWIDEGEAHDCWTTTEDALTADLSDDLREAWERLRESLADLGDQRIYASGSCIMFARNVCYVFVRPKRAVLEICIFLDRALRGPRVRRAERKSRVKFANLVHVQHRDEVEPPLTDWLGEAYDLLDRLATAKDTNRTREGRAEALPYTTKAKAKATKAKDTTKAKAKKAGQLSRAAEAKTAAKANKAAKTKARR